ncbi:hypothetical protein V2J09_020598 [Rumex salicifolius]
MSTQFPFALSPPRLPVIDPAATSLTLLPFYLRSVNTDIHWHLDMEIHGNDDMDSLFEGMVIANDAGDGSDPASLEKNSDAEELQLSSSSQPLDENLFSDLTVITPSQSDIVGPDLSTTTKGAGVLEKEATRIASISRQSSRKKRRAGGLRIGYGRDLQQLNDQTEEKRELDSQSIHTLPPARKSLQAMMDLDGSFPDTTEENEDSARVSTSKPDVVLENRHVDSHLSAKPEKEREPLPDEVIRDAGLNTVQDSDVVSEVKESIQDGKVVSGPSDDEEETSKQVKKGEEKQKESDPSLEGKYEHVKAEISGKLRHAQEMITSISSARKDSKRRRRKAAEEFELASQRYRNLEKQLEDACEAEDFEMADTLSEKLASTDQEKQHLLNILREAEADSDSIDSKMQEVLEFQIASEEECISLLQQFSQDCASNANSLIENAELKSSKEIDEWFASMESFEAKKMELEITSDIINNACSTLNNSIEMSVENDRREKDLLHEKKAVLMDELESLLALVRAKEAEIAETDSKVEAVDKRIAEVISGFGVTRSGVDLKFENLQSDLSEMERQSEALSMRKKEIDDFLSCEKDRGESLRNLAKMSGDEAKEYQENLELRKSLMLSVAKSREEKVRLASTEEKILADIQSLRQEISAARASLQDLSSRKSNIQQDLASKKQQIFFIDKRIPELEAEKKVAASARNFKEAARIATEAKTLITEKERQQVTIEEATLELVKLDNEINEATTKIHDIEGLVSSMERELAVTQFQRLSLLAISARSERTTALELGDVEEASVLLAEAEAAESIAEQLQIMHDISIKKLEEMPRSTVSEEDVGFTKSILLSLRSAAVSAELTMSSATARFFTLLASPLPLRYLHLHRPSLLFLSSPRLLLSRSPPPRSSLHLPRRFHFSAHAQTPNDEQFNDYSPSSTFANGAGGSSSWPEWFKLINSPQFSRYFDRLHGNLGFEEFLDDGASLPGDFVKSVNACLAFAREHETRSLSRKDMETIVENGTPFLFKDAADTVRRMKSFLNGSPDHVMGGDKPSTVDVMKFLLSYASTTLVSSETHLFSSREIVEGSARRLFSQLAEISGAPESTLHASVPNQFPGTGTDWQPPRSFDQTAQMKKGDWVCPRCRFMNFARNMKCLECEETRPKRQLTGGEWECPQCDFFNYGRNSACLRCDCKKPAISNPVAGSGYNYYSKNESSDKQSTVNQEQVPSWLHKISQLENTSNQGNVSLDKTFAETVLFKEGAISESNTLNQADNKSIDGKISQRFEKILEQSTNAFGASSQNSNTLGNTGGKSFSAPTETASPSDDDYPDNMPIRKGESSFVVREKKDRSLTSPLYKRRMAMEQSKNNNYVPFVPFPPNHFARDQQPVKEEPPARNSYDQQSFDQSKFQPMTNQQTNPMSWNQDYTQQTQNFQGVSSVKYQTPTSQSSDDQKLTGQWRGSSLEGSAVKEEPDPLDMSEEAKAERWFKRVAQIKDIKELSEIPDEDFPSIMPMRKGVNRFVVSKRKTPLERRLASSQYRRNLPVVKSDPFKDNDDSES